MSNRSLAMILGASAVVFLVLNFTVEAGTLFLILAVVAGLSSVYLASRRQ